MEEGLLTRSHPLLEEAKSEADGELDGCSDTHPPNDSTATLVVVLSTLVALCGSLSCGCVVSAVNHNICFYIFGSLLSAYFIIMVLNAVRVHFTCWIWNHSRFGPFNCNCEYLLMNIISCGSNLAHFSYFYNRERKKKQSERKKMSKQLISLCLLQLQKLNT